MPAAPTTMDTVRATNRRRSSLIAALRWTPVALGAGSSLLLAGTGRDPGFELVAWVLHILAPATLLPIAVQIRGPGAALFWVLLVVAAIPVAPGVVPGVPASERTWLLAAHTLAGSAALAVLSVTTLGRELGAALRCAIAVMIVLPGVWAASARVLAAHWDPPRYDAERVYQFLTATTAGQAQAPLFPSAIRWKGSQSGCGTVGCHSDTLIGAHGTSASSPGYGAILRDFTRRRGVEAARWCQGCHAPEALRAEVSARIQGLECESCHAVEQVHGVYGSAPLTLHGRPASSVTQLLTKVRPGAHGAQSLRPALHRSAEFCAACHRKNWSLPQNGYRWLPGPDEYSGWMAGPYGPGVLTDYAPSVRSRSCADCHSAHRAKPPKPAEPVLSLDLFLRPPAGATEAWPLEAAERLRPGEAVLLDVVVSNRGIGHDFPTGMPDLQESWLEVVLTDGAGRRVGANGVREPAGGDAHRYRLAAVDREGRLLRHGDLDRMVAVREWRRIPAGEADVARYSFRVPKAGLGAVSVRLLRRRRPEFLAWAGDRRPNPVEELARVERRPDQPLAGADDTRRWREYARGLANVKALAQALGALGHAGAPAPKDPEAALLTGRVYLDEGNLLDALAQFRHAPGGGDRARGWEAAVLRRMGQAEAAIAIMEPLTRRHPRDPKLRFELGQAYLQVLRNEDAAREFQRLLEVDPLDANGHLYLMLAWQRLNRQADAQMEEDIYELLKPDESPEVKPGARSEESLPLHVHRLEPGAR